LKSQRQSAEARISQSSWGAKLEKSLKSFEFSTVLKNSRPLKVLGSSSLKVLEKFLNCYLQSVKNAFANNSF